jgi:hypothetical protein
MKLETSYKPFSRRDFAALGVGHYAYVKAIEHEGEPAYAVHGADGTPMAVIADRLVAAAAIRQLDLEPLSVH